MNSLTLTLSAIAVLSCLASLPAAAQQREVAPVPRAVNPNMSMSGPTNSPLQAQTRENYATSLRSEQRELLRQNPSGLTRDELAIGHELNGYVRPR